MFLQHDFIRKSTFIFLQMNRLPGYGKSTVRNMQCPFQRNFQQLHSPADIGTGTVSLHGIIRIKFEIKSQTLKLVTW